MKSVNLSSHPTLRRLSIAAGFVLAFAAGTLANTLVRDHDPKLDLAIDSLTKTDALLNAATSGELSKHNQKAFDKQLARAIQAVGDATTAVLAAIDASEGGQ